MNCDEQEDRQIELARIKNPEPVEELNFKTLLERFYLSNAPQKVDDRQLSFQAGKTEAVDRCSQDQL